MLSHCRVSNQLNRQLLISQQVEEVVARGGDSVVDVFKANSALMRDFEWNFHELLVLFVSVVLWLQLYKILVYFFVDCDQEEHFLPVEDCAVSSGECTIHHEQEAKGLIIRRKPQSWAIGQSCSMLAKPAPGRCFCALERVSTFRGRRFRSNTAKKRSRTFEFTGKEMFTNEILNFLWIK